MKRFNDYTVRSLFAFTVEAVVTVKSEPYDTQEAFEVGADMLGDIEWTLWTAIQAKAAELGVRVALVDEGEDFDTLGSLEVEYLEATDMS